MGDLVITDAIGIIIAEAIGTTIAVAMATTMITLIAKRKEEELTGLASGMVAIIQDADGETTMTMTMTIAIVNNRKKAESLQEMETFRSGIWVPEGA